ncbi:hypothetical protein FVW20_05015 [Desulfovibrio oxamicus]|uniref:Uncharacterized protein n=1 Tax=Nitratidesulfovibrio oxamicus TaxID=32016 RepID=A0ABS0J3V4_9BACT|nr:hypothetical protein [Nitratidesulfovibrio oxamicus]MBG3876403.1 hypothetical protein [Nitratidesulfovibrio oxamicus]
MATDTVMKPVRSLLTRLKPRKSVSTLIASTLLITLVIIGFMRFLPERKPYVSISANSEFATYRVTREKAAEVPLNEAAYRGDIASCPRLEELTGKKALTGRLEPSTGSIVTYRNYDGEIAIAVSAGPHGPGTLNFADGPPCSLGTRSIFVLNGKTGSVPPLPIAGPADIGREYGEPPIPDGQRHHPTDHMSAGSIQIFGRSRLAPYLGALYPVSSASFPLPAGGRLSSGDNLSPSGQHAQAEPWYGIAEVRNDGFRISATTATANLYLYRPGATGETERFALDAFVGPLSDPSVILLTVFFAIVTMTLKSVSVVITLLRDDKGK